MLLWGRVSHEMTVGSHSGGTHDEPSNLTEVGVAGPAKKASIQPHPNTNTTACYCNTPATKNSTPSTGGVWGLPCRAILCRLIQTCRKSIDIGMPQYSIAWGSVSHARTVHSRSSSHEPANQQAEHNTVCVGALQGRAPTTTLCGGSAGPHSLHGRPWLHIR